MCIWIVGFRAQQTRKFEPSYAYPGYQRFFSRAAGIFGVGRRPKPRAGHYKDLTETGNRARKVSGTQGILCSTFNRTIGKSSVALYTLVFYP